MGTLDALTPGMLAFKGDLAVKWFSGLTRLERAVGTGFQNAALCFGDKGATLSSVASQLK